jgi:hypothetical protein
MKAASKESSAYSFYAHHRARSPTGAKGLLGPLVLR